MSLDITIKQNDKVVHSCNFYGFKNYSSPDRVNLAMKSGYEEVKDYWTYEAWVNKVVSQKINQKFYLELITDQNAPITIEIS